MVPSWFPCGTSGAIRRSPTNNPKLPASLHRRDGDLDTIRVNRAGSHERNIALGITTFNGLEGPAEARQDIASLNRDVELRGATSWAATKGNKSPVRTQSEPSFRSEVLGILAPDVLIAMKDALVDLNHIAMSDKDGRLTVRATA